MNVTFAPVFGEEGLNVKEAERGGWAVGEKNSVRGVAAASFVARLARFQFVSIVFVKE